MKVKELIEQLEKCNKEAEIDVTILESKGASLSDTFSVVAAEQHNPNLVDIYIK